MSKVSEFKSVLPGETQAIIFDFTRPNKDKPINEISNKDTFIKPSATPLKEFISLINGTKKQS